MTPEHFDDPVAAYDRLAPDYAKLARRRDLYLRGVEREITTRVAKSTRSLLDVGSGDGTRALRIASQAGLDRVVLVEPSQEMAGKSAQHAEVWPVRAEALAPMSSERFDVITCLWNVLGHIPTAEKRGRALAAIARLLSPNGKFFLDVSHRYNLRSYGVLLTSARWIHDHLVHRESNGDVTAKWAAGGASLSTYGHVFTNREITRLAGAAGLELEERVVIDYENGRVRRYSFRGNLLYVFRRSS